MFNFMELSVTLSSSLSKGLQEKFKGVLDLREGLSSKLLLKRFPKPMIYHSLVIYNFCSNVGHKKSDKS